MTNPNWNIVHDECDEKNEERIECPMCRGQAYTIGQLGGTTHYRCRNCGWVFMEVHVGVWDNAQETGQR